LTYLLSVWVSDTFRVDPILRLLVLRVIDLLGRVDSGGKVFEDIATVLALAIEKNIISVVRATMSHEF